jgi:hypothetical protein
MGGARAWQAAFEVLRWFTAGAGVGCGACGSSAVAAAAAEQMRNTSALVLHPGLLQKLLPWAMCTHSYLPDRPHTCCMLHTCRSIAGQETTAALPAVSAAALESSCKLTAPGTAGEVLLGCVRQLLLFSPIKYPFTM